MMGLRYLFSLNTRRLWACNMTPEGPLRRYFQTPFPSPDSAWDEVEYLALDFETTGLDPKDDQILSAGFCEIREGALQMNSSEHILVRPTRSIPESSAVVHGILDDQSATGLAIGEAIPLLLEALAGKVLVAHHAAIEYQFLDHACRRLYGHGFLCPVVDTLALEHHTFKKRDAMPKPGELRLAEARLRYGLPRYRAHDALVDALSAGELFLAQAAHRSTGKSGKPCQLGDLLSKSA